MYVLKKLIVSKFIFVPSKLIVKSKSSLGALKAQQRNNVNNHIYEIMVKNLRKLLKNVREYLSYNTSVGALYITLTLKTDLLLYLDY